MASIQHLMLALDPDAPGEAAVSVALDLARRCGSTLRIVDVMEEPPRHFWGHGFDKEVVRLVREERTARLAAVAARSKTPVTTELLQGHSRWHALVRHGEQVHTDLLVLPADARPGGPLFGTACHHLFRKFPGAVLAVAPSLEGAPRRLLAAVEPSLPETRDRELSQDVMEVSALLAVTIPAELHVVHAWEFWGEKLLDARLGPAAAQPYRQYAQDTARRAVDELCQDPRWRNRVADVHLRKGDPGDVVPAAARELDADLVVLGTTARSWLDGFMMGSRAETILQHLDRSVLVVKPAGFSSATVHDE